MSKPLWKRIVLTTGLVTFMTVKWIIISVVISGFAVGGVAFGYLASILKDEPIRSEAFIREELDQNIINGFVYFNDGELIGQLRSDESRQLAQITDIPEILIQATLAIEDDDFYEHPGFDLNGVLRATRQFVFKEDVQTGGSTITQQVARRVFLTPDREISRKMKEIFLSIRMEQYLTKNEILMAYLNKILYGNGSDGYTVYGIVAAAKGIFGVEDLNDLNIAQAAYLAGLPQLPSSYSAFTSRGEFDPAGFERAINRQKLVLRRMLEEEVITQAQHDQALRFDLKSSLAETSEKAYSTYPYLMVEVEQKAAEALVRMENPQLAAEMNTNREAYNEAVSTALNKLLRSGYHIHTTIDKTIYDMMHEIAQDESNFTPDLPDIGKDGIEQIGAIMIENKTGAILGMMEGRDFYTEQLNHVTQAYRQPGSTIKTIAAYIPALEMGLIQPATVIDDSPIILPDGQKGFHIPTNWDNRYNGLVTAREALNRSFNIPALKLFLYEVGIETAWDYAQRMGINSIVEQDYHAQTGIIGGLHRGVNVEELTNAFSTIPNQGVFYDAYLIEKIVDSNGNVIYQHERNPTRVYSEQTAYLINDMQRTVITSGTATSIMRNFRYYNEVAVSGKTGSTQGDADAWFMGYTPDISLGVWAGYPQPVNKLVGTAGRGRAQSVWALVMNEAYELRPELFENKSFERPDDIVQMTVSSVSGKLHNDLTRSSGRSVTDIFNRKYVPVEEDDVMVQMQYITYNGVNYIPHPETPEEFLQDQVVIRREKSVSAILQEIRDSLERYPNNTLLPMGNYVPLDAGQDAPSQLDPRVDDGTAPSTPQGLSVVYANDDSDTLHISFQPSPEEDIVGYRLYRSIDGSPFVRVASQVSDQDHVFTDTALFGFTIGYYVAAVDVVGQESPAGEIAYPDGSPYIPPDDNGGDNGESDDNDNGDEGSDNGNGSGSSPSPSPSPSTGPGGNGNLPGLPSPPAEPGTPNGLLVTDGGISIRLSWDANSNNQNIDLYNVYYSEDESGPYNKLGESTSTEFVYFTNTKQGYYRITAVNSLGESSMSIPVFFEEGL